MNLKNIETVQRKVLPHAINTPLMIFSDVLSNQKSIDTFFSLTERKNRRGKLDMSIAWKHSVENNATTMKGLTTSHPFYSPCHRLQLLGKEITDNIEKCRSWNKE